MDQITHEMRLKNWTHVVEECNNRPKDVTVKQWLADNGINEKVYYYWLRVYVLHMSEVNNRRSYDSDNVIIYGHNIRHEQFGFGRKVIVSRVLISVLKMYF